MRILKSLEIKVEKLLSFDTKYHFISYIKYRVDDG